MIEIIMLLSWARNMKEKLPLIIILCHSIFNMNILRIYFDFSDSVFVLILSVHCPIISQRENSCRFFHSLMTATIKNSLCPCVTCVILSMRVNTSIMRDFSLNDCFSVCLWKKVVWLMLTLFTKNNHVDGWHEVVHELRNTFKSSKISQKLTKLLRFLLKSLEQFGKWNMMFIWFQSNSIKNAFPQLWTSKILFMSMEQFGKWNTILFYSNKKAFLIFVSTISQHFFI